MLSLSLLFLITALLFAHGAHAFRAFEPNCTSPHDHVTWVSPPPLRGTMDIIFSCFSVLLICTWAIQHLSVPPHKTHFWNHKIIKSKQYSAFLDDARFNYTKLKWMGMSLLAPEYILAKALSELLAAHDSRRQFTEWRKAQKLPKQSDQKDWTTTHGYFVNMGGFILRFDVEAVKIPLEPRKPDEFERSLFKRNPDEDPPYLPQSLVDAEAQELKQCHEGAPCENHPDGPHVDRDGSSRGGDSDAQPPSAVSENHPLLQVVVDSQGRTTALERIQGPLISENSPEDLLKFTPSTLIQMPGVSPISTPVTVVNRHGFPMNSTPITAVSDHQFPFPAKDTSTANGSEYELRRLDATDAVHSHNNHQSANPTAVRKEKERLVPHKKWQATWALSSMQMLYAIRKGIIPLPDTSAEDLNDRSKGDALVKGLAVLHITWLVIQILARGVEGMAITQLEIMILGFSACALVT